MKRFVKIIALVLSVCFVFCSCGNNSTNESTPDETVAGERVKFTMENGAGSTVPKFLKADVLADPESSVELSQVVLSDEESGKFDIIVSNPPYVMDKEKALMRTNVLDHEPHLALFVSDDDPLVFYRAVADWASKLLKVGGYGVVEINEALGEQTAEVFRIAGFSGVRVIKDLSDRDRFVEFTRIN